MKLSVISCVLLLTLFLCLVTAEEHASSPSLSSASSPTSASTSVSSSSSSLTHQDNWSVDPNKHAIFIAIPLIGHLTPLLQQGFELARRGWRITFATTGSAQAAVHNFVQEFVRLDSEYRGGIKRNYDIAVIDGGITCEMKGDLHSEFRMAASLPYRDSTAHIMLNYVLPMWPCLYGGLLPLLRERVQSVNAEHTVAVVDAYSHAGFDLADTLAIPWMVHSADPLYAFSSRILPPDDLLPTVASTYSKQEMGIGYLQRLTLPIVRQLIRSIIKLNVDPSFNSVRAEYGLEPVDTFTHINGHMILSMVPLSLEPPRVFGPLINIVGGMLPPYYTPLSKEELTWLDQYDTPVVFVSMGTIAQLSTAQMLGIAEGLVGTAHELKEATKQFRVIWKLNEKQQQELVGMLGVEDLDSWLKQHNAQRRVWITRWVTSQQSLLKHDKLRAFVSHCGCNSIIEAAAFAVPVVCIPMFADQLDMGVRAKDQGFGVWIDKFNVTGNAVQQGVLRMLDNDSDVHTHAIPRAQHLQHLAGGVSRAADLIEHMAYFGSSHLATAGSQAPEWVEWNVDVHATWFIAILILFKFMPCVCYYCCCCCCCCRGWCVCRKQKQKKKSE
jgi:UDP:flavonoid glycosyltransferase YjiC (YdhE family)